MEVPPIGGQTDCMTLERSNSRSQRAMSLGRGRGGGGETEEPHVEPRGDVPGAPNSVSSGATEGAFGGWWRDS